MQNNTNSNAGILIEGIELREWTPAWEDWIHLFILREYTCFKWEYNYVHTIILKKKYFFVLSYLITLGLLY